MKGEKTISDYFCRVSPLIKVMRIQGEDNSERKFVEKILRSPPVNFNIWLLPLRS